MFPFLARGDCTCDPEDENRDKSQVLKYKMAAIACILLAGSLGVCFPQLGKTIKALRPEKNFAAGVILSTGFIHVLSDATENLTSPCLNENLWGKFPFAGLVAMTASIGTLMVDVLATSHYTKSHLQKPQQSLHGDQENTGENEIHLAVLELGTVVHSVIIGIFLGMGLGAKQAELNRHEYVPPNESRFPLCSPGRHGGSVEFFEGESWCNEM
ncbi:hypothetical protein V6N13_149728 [Hibiscus sabdariffa]|uniref:Uncharacterized protein n=1 Tax=Hibiscus sabdariffa TaxID=183260 RepID=A0ABR2EGH7_9ROSI